MEMMKLTEANYYSPEANWQYMSASQFKNFKRCESAAMADLCGDLPRKESKALLVGSYVDAYFSGEMEQFKEKHPEIFKKDGTLKVEFIQAQKVAERLERDELARMLLSGEHQTIRTGKIAGVWYKTKSDSRLSASQVEEICKKFPQIRELVPFGGAMIVDLKCMRDFEDVWDEELGEAVNFVEYWGYDIQGAIYQEVDEEIPPFVIISATKEDEPNIEAMYIPDEDLAFLLAEVKELSPRYDAIKRGEIEPIGCGKCAWCRSTKRLSMIKHYRQIKEM